MPKYKDYRICYEGGNAISGREVYELHTLCKCSSCMYRLKYRIGIANQATATTKNIQKIDEVAEFLETWTCGETKEVKTVYYQF